MTELPPRPATILGAVIVTGASSGIGRATAIALLEAGFRVFSTVRKAEDCASLEALGCEPFVMDITDRDAILHARNDMLTALGSIPLAGLVNNAGIASLGPWEHIELEDVRHLMDVNFLGTVAVTQAFLSRLRTDRGRIVMIGSVAGRLAKSIFGAYAATKFALRAVADSLRRELDTLGVRVILIEVGATRTPILEKLKTDLAVADVYASAFDWSRRHISTVSETGLAPEVVAAAVVKAMTARSPRSNILVVNYPNLLYRIYLVLPGVLIDAIAKLQSKR